MNDTINKLKIQELLRGCTPLPTAEKIADWAMKNRYLFAMDQLKIDGSPERLAAGKFWHLLTVNCLVDKAAAGEALLADYCRVHGTGYLGTSENADFGLDFLARKFNYADRASLKQHQPDLYDALFSALARHPWRSYNYVRSMLDAKDRDYALNTFWSAWVKMAEPRWIDLLKERQSASCASAYMEYSREDLFAGVMAFMQASKDAEHTYNEVAKALKIHPKNIPLIMSVKDTLNRLADPAQTIYNDVAKYKTLRGKRTTEVFRWCPARRKLDAAIPSKRDEVIAEEILVYLIATPYKSVRAIQAHCRDAFGRIDNSKVIARLHSMTVDGVLLTEDGPRGAKLHYPAPPKSLPNCATKQPSATHFSTQLDRSGSALAAF